MHIRKTYLFYVFFLLILLSGCGGNIGRIERYHFDVHEYKLKNAVNETFKEYPKMVKPDTTSSYSGGYKNLDQYIMIEHQNTYYVIPFRVRSEEHNSSFISLISGGKYGDVINVAPRMEKEEKQFYEKIFKRYFIRKLEKELGVEAYTKMFSL